MDEPKKSPDAERDSLQAERDVIVIGPDGEPIDVEFEGITPDDVSATAPKPSRAAE